LPLVALTGMARDPSGSYDHLTYTLIGTHSLSLPILSPAAWLALAGASALGGLLPDIDQPGSLVTRLPANQARSFRRAGAGMRWGPTGTLTRPTLATADAAGRLATAFLGGYGGRLDRLFTLLLWLLAFVAGGEAVVARWLPPAELLVWPVEWRNVCALSLASIASCSILVALGGVSGLVNRLPGHHRGWTHAPPAAIAICALSNVLGPALAPALPGLGAAFSCGYLSHLLADALTIRGIPLWWPGASQPSLHLLPRHLRVRTGSGGESIFNLCWPVLAATVIIVGSR